MFSIKEAAALSGVSIRTLRHYDNIGLLHPSSVTAAGYRFYDESALERLQDILLFRELEFPLREIKNILDDPNFDREKALEQQIALLRLRRERIDAIISLAEKIKDKEENTLNFSAFDKTKLESYAEEAKQKWGSTPAFEEYEKKSANRTDEKSLSLTEGMMGIFAEFGKVTFLSPEGPEAQQLVKKLQAFITENYYTCTDEILASLGQMYSADSRFAENIDNFGGKGTADFASKAIAFYCKK